MGSLLRDPPRYARINSEWTVADSRGAILCRLGRFRMRYRVEPGLYALGKPDMNSPVFVSANYKLSFDVVRKGLRGLDCWILVLDTRGFNVWCAAGAGTFGSEELVERIVKARLDEVVRHRTLIVPQLGATGISAQAVKKHSGFQVRFGPVRSADIPAYLSNGCAASREMRQVRFGIVDRMVLTPMELGQSLLRFSVFALAAFIVAGLTPGGVVFGKAWSGAWPLFVLGLGAIFSGSFIVPLLLPWIPTRAFSLKGLITGAAVTAVFLHGARLASGMDPFMVAACWLFFPAASAYMALGFTGATTFTSLSGVRREIRLSLPLFIAAAAFTLAALVFSKLRQWGVV